MKKFRGKGDHNKYTIIKCFNTRNKRKMNIGSSLKNGLISIIICWGKLKKINSNKRFKNQIKKLQQALNTKTVC
jgi:hypothetical protein